MSQLAALSLSIAVLGGLATWVFLTVGGILIWAAFVAWACFFHTGGDSDALRNTIVSNVFGSLVASIAAIVILAIPLADKLTLPLWAAIVVGVSVWVSAERAPRRGDSCMVRLGCFLLSCANA
jgi:hypothetical protein